MQSDRRSRKNGSEPDQDAGDFAQFASAIKNTPSPSSFHAGSTTMKPTTCFACLVGAGLWAATAFASETRTFTMAAGVRAPIPFWIHQDDKAVFSAQGEGDVDCVLKMGKSGDTIVANSTSDKRCHIEYVAPLGGTYVLVLRNLEPHPNLVAFGWTGAKPDDR
jgi:hypothetical protein